MLNVKVCEVCIADRRRIVNSHNGCYYPEGANDRVMLHDIIRCRTKWLSAKLSAPPKWCKWKLEHLVSHET